MSASELTRTVSDVPGPPPANSLGAAYKLLQSIKGDLLGVLLQGFEQYGDMYKLEVLGRKQLLVRDPALVRTVLLDNAEHYNKGKDYTDRRKGIAKFTGDGLLTSNGEHWKKQRKLVAPALHMRRIASYVDAMVAASARMLEGWKPGAELTLEDEMTHVTLDIVGRSLFSADVSGDVSRIADAMGAMHGMIEANNSAWTLLPGWFPTPQRAREGTAVRTLDEIIYRLIRERRPTEAGPVTDRGDLCSMLLLAKDEDGTPMGDVEVRDEIVTTFLAGHETTANALNWLWILLANNHEAEAKLHEEVDRVLAGGPATLEHVKQLTFTECIVKEALRLYPPVFTFMRSAIASTTLGPYALPVGTDVSLFPYCTHRMASLFERPLDFRPERFEGELGKSYDKYAWIPFGGGARVCIGTFFAMTEAVIIVAMTAARFKLKVTNATPIVPAPALTLRPQGPVKITLEARR